jgi:hypothetical protein
MTDRKPIGKSVRFKVFKRDGFVCQYCGNKPPSVVLEIDHIHPVSEGGNNHMDNLITACFDCNRGKSNGLLSSVPPSLEERAVLMREKQDQIKSYEKLLREIKKSEDARIDVIDSVFRNYYQGFQLSEKFKSSSLRQFTQNLPIDVVEGAMIKACSRIAGRGGSGDDAIKYFCGICWRTIKDSGVRW